MTIRSAIAFLLCFPVVAQTQPQTQPAQSAPEDWIRTIDEALDQPPPPLLDNVAVLPAVAPNKTIIPGGQPIQLCADSLMRYGRSRRMKGSTCHVLEINRWGEYFDRGRVLTEHDLKTFAAAAGASIYALPILKTVGDRYELTVSLADVNDARRPRTRTHSVPVSDAGLLPGLVARDALEYVGAVLSQAQLADLAAPQAKSFDEYLELNKLMHQPDNERKPPPFDKFLKAHPWCLASWTMWGCYGPRETFPGAIDRFKPSVAIEGLPVARVQIVPPDVGRRIFRKMVPLMATHRDDAFYLKQLASAAVGARDERLIHHVLNVWDAAPQNYLDLFYRGMFMRELAVQFGNESISFSRKDWPTSKAMYEEAKRCLDAAIARNPRDFLARTLAIRICLDMGAKPNVDDYFLPARQANLLCYYAYYYKSDQLSGGPLGQAMDFAVQCADPKLAPSRIPLLFYGTLHGRNPRDPAVGRLFIDDRNWDRLTFLRGWIGKNQPKDNPAMGEIYAMLATSSGRYSLAVEEYSRIRPRFDCIGGCQGYSDHEMFRDVAHSRAGKPPEKWPAVVRLHLDAGDSDAAEKALAEALAADPAAIKPDDAERFRKAVALHRRLLKDRVLVFDPKTFLDTWTFAGGGTWTRDGGKIVCRAPSEAVAISPFAVKSAELTGTINVRGGEFFRVTVATRTRSLQDRLNLRWSFWNDGTEWKVGLHVGNGGGRTWPFKMGPQDFKITLLPARQEFAAGSSSRTLYGQQEPLGRFEIGGKGTGKGTLVFDISNLKVRLLAPPEPEDPN